jgi:TolA-binding protein
MLLGCCVCWTFGSVSIEAAAQEPIRRTQPSAQTSRPNAGKPPAKVDPATAAKRDIVNLYTDAANFQNAGAYPLAIDAWKKFLDRYPNDELSSKARHYLGVCFLQAEKPEYDGAIASFREALRDSKLEVREETLINLGWTLFYTARSSGADIDKNRLKESLKVLNEFLENYPDGTYADKATFYAAESEYLLGNVQQASTRYRLLVNNEKFEKSSVLPDALYALGVSYEEQNQPKLAAETYDRFLKQFADHRLSREVRLRKAEYLLNNNEVAQAVAMFADIAKDKNVPMRDYVLYRYGFALAKAGRFQESSDVYQELAKEFPNSQFSSESNLSAGQALMREKKYDEAKGFFQKLISKKDETAAQAAHWLAQIAILQNKPEDVVRIARDALGWAGDSQWRVALQIDLADALANTSDGAEEATSIYESVALEHEDHPAAPRAAYNAAFAALKASRVADATKWSDYFAKRFPQDPLASEVAFVKAESLLQAGKRADAAAAFEQLIAAYPKSANIEQWKLRLGSAYFFAEEFDKAAPVLTELAKSSADTAVRGESYFLLGASSFKKADYPKAIDYLGRSIAIEPAWNGVDEAYIILAEAHSKSGDDAKAKATLEALLSKHPNSPFKTQAQFRLGQLSAADKDYAKAVVYYDAVLAANDEPELIDYARYGKAWVLIQQSKFEEALDIALQVSGKSTDPSLRLEASLAAAICLRETGRAGEAVRVLETFYRGAAGKQASPEVQAKLMMELGISYSQSNQFEEASKTFKTLATQHPEFPNIDKVMFENAWALKRAGKDDLAVAEFKELGTRFPSSPMAAEAFYHVAQQSYDKQEFDSAVKAYTIAVSKTNDDVVREKSLYKLGWTYFQTNQWDQAARFFGDLAREYSEGDLVVDAVFMLGECSMKKQQYKEAVKHYNRARKLIADPAIHSDQVDPQVVELTYLHGAQAAREIKDWDNVIEFADQLSDRNPQSNFLQLAQFEKAIALQNKKSYPEAIEIFGQIAEENRNELGARSRFMLGEIYFSKREFSSAIQEFQKVMYGFGATQAPEEIKNWQARAAIEAGRCSDLLIGDLRGEARIRAVNVSKGFYEFVVKNHSAHEMALIAKDRLAELAKLSQ